MLKENPSAPSSYVPSARSGGPGKRRNFRAADKRRIVEETWREGEDGLRIMLVIADAGLQAIGVDADEKTSKQSRSTKPPPKQRRRAGQAS